jgi:hypothetical protein
MKVRGGAVGLLAVWLLAGPSHAQAAAQRVKLRYSAPAECPDDLELVQAVEEFLGQSLREAREQALAIEVRAQGDRASGYSAKLTFVGAQGTQERFADHPDCGKLTEAAALMVAIAIDPERVKARQRAETKPDEAVAPSAPANPEPAPPPAPSRPESEAAPTRDRGAEPLEPPRDGGPGPEPSVTLLVLTNHGALPNVAPGVGADFSARLGAFEAGVGGRYWVSRDASVPNASTSSIEVSLVTGGLRLCGVPERGYWSIPVCARGDLGDMEGTGQRVDNARTRHALFATVGGSLALSYTRHRLVPLAGLELHWTLARPRFGVLREGRAVEAFRPDEWGVGGFVGLSYRL